MITRKRNQQPLNVNKRLKVTMADDNKTSEKTTFLVGGDDVSIKTYSSILAASSPVFKAMLFGSMANKSGPVQLKEDCPEAFRALIEYVRTKRMIVEDFGVALRLAKMAHKYMMPELMNECMKYMAHDNDHWYVLEYYELLKLTSKDDFLIHRILVCCQLVAEELLESNRHLNVGVDTLIDLFKGNSLNIISEITLVEALDRYEEANDDPSLKDGLRTALSHVGLLTLEPMQILECSIIKKLLNPVEIENIIENIVSPSNADKKPNHSSKCRGLIWNNIRCIRNCTGELTTTILEKHTLCSANLYGEGVYIKGVIFGVASNQTVPFLDVIVSFYDFNGTQLANERYRLRNLTNNGKNCIFLKGKTALVSNQRYRLNVLIMNRVSFTGRFCGPTLSPKVSIECNEKEPINCFLKGLLYKKIQ